jgi:hypothetical protein
MDRREYLKLMLAGSVGTGLLIATSCTDEDQALSEKIISDNSYGRIPEELQRDNELREAVFFTAHERKTIEILCDLIIPADEFSGGATDAGVPDFIEFMMKDIPSMQVPTRGGLMWLDNQSRKLYNKDFVDCSTSDQQQLIEEIAYPQEGDEEMQYGVRFFNRIRDLTATGFFTSEIGIEYLGYQGNRATMWDGVPPHVLKNHGMSYDQKTLDESLKPENRTKIAEWDDEGNLL